MVVYLLSLFPFPEEVKWMLREFKMTLDHVEEYFKSVCECVCVSRGGEF